MFLMMSHFRLQPFRYVRAHYSHDYGDIAVALGLAIVKSDGFNFASDDAGTP